MSENRSRSAHVFHFGSCDGRSRNHCNSISGTTGSLFNLSQPKSNVTPHRSGTGASTSQSSSRAQGDRYSFSSRRSRGTVLSFRSSLFHGAGPDSPVAAKRYRESRTFVSPGGSRSKPMGFRNSISSPNLLGRGMDVSPANSTPEVSYVRSRYSATRFRESSTYVTPGKQLCFRKSIFENNNLTPEESHVRSRNQFIPDAAKRCRESRIYVSPGGTRSKRMGFRKSIFENDISPQHSVRPGTDVSPANSTPEVSYVRSRNPDAANRFRKSGSYVSPSGTVFENNISPNSVSRGTDVSPANSTPEVSRVRSRCAMSSIIL